MQTSEMQDFEQQLSVLCAGYNLPVTPHRKHAYFVGLAKMSLVQFTRVVEYAVSDDGPEDFPTSKAVWKLHREILRHARVQAPKPSDAHEPDHVEFLANRLLLDVWWNRPGFGSVGTFKPAYGLIDCQTSPLLVALLAEKRRLVNWWSGPIREGDPACTPHAFMQDFAKTIGKLVEISEQLRTRWQETYSSRDGLAPFPGHMGRESAYIDSFHPKLSGNVNSQENLL